MKIEEGGIERKREDNGSGRLGGKEMKSGAGGREEKRGKLK
jgi:hypothetical protein